MPPRAAAACSLVARLGQGDPLGWGALGWGALGLGEDSERRELDVCMYVWMDGCMDGWK